MTEGDDLLHAFLYHQCPVHLVSDWLWEQRSETNKSRVDDDPVSVWINAGNPTSLLVFIGKELLLCECVHSATEVGQWLYHYFSYKGYKVCK